MPFSSETVRPGALTIPSVTLLVAVVGGYLAFVEVVRWAYLRRTGEAAPIGEMRPAAS